MGLFDKKERMRFALTVAPDVVFPGDTVTVEVAVTGPPDPKVTRTRLSFEAPLAVSHDDVQVGGFGSIDVYDHKTHHHEAVDGPTAPGTYQYTFTVPAGAVPLARFTGHWASNWRVTLESRESKYQFVEAPVRVRRRDTGQPGRDTLPAVARKESDAASVHAAVPRRLRAGVPVAGTIRVLAQRDVEVRGLELRLAAYMVRRFVAAEPLPLDPLHAFDDVPKGARCRNVETYTKPVPVQPTWLTAGEFLDVPVEFRIPTEDWPTYTSGLTRTHWVLHVYVDLGGASDPQLDLELDVFNA